MATNTLNTEQNDWYITGNNFMWEIICVLIQISQKFVAQGPICNKATLVQVTVWHLKGDKPLPEPMLTRISDAIWCHKATMSNISVHSSKNITYAK